MGCSGLWSVSLTPAVLLWWEGECPSMDTSEPAVAWLIGLMVEGDVLVSFGRGGES